MNFMYSDLNFEKKKKKLLISRDIYVNRNMCRAVYKSYFFCSVSKIIWLVSEFYNDFFFSCDKR